MSNSTVSLQVIWALNVGRSGVRRDDLVAKFQAAGLRVPRPPAPKALLTRAVERCRKGRSGWLGDKRIDGGIGFISHEVGDDGKRFNPRHFCTAFTQVVGGKAQLCFNYPSPEALTVDEREFVDELKSAFKLSAEFANATDLRTIMQRAVCGARRVVGMGGVPVVGNGVQAYWVPAQFKTEVQALQSIVEDLSPNSRVDVFSVTDQDGNLAAVRRHVRHQQMQELGELREDVRNLISEGKNSPKTIEAKMQAFSRLDGAVALWKDVLGDIAVELVEGVAQARKDLQDELGLETSDSPRVGGSAQRLLRIVRDREEGSAFNLNEAVEMMSDEGCRLSCARTRQLLLELAGAGLLVRDPETGRGFYRAA